MHAARVCVVAARAVAQREHRHHDARRRREPLANGSAVLKRRDGHVAHQQCLLAGARGHIELRAEPGELRLPQLGERRRVTPRRHRGRMDAVEGIEHLRAPSVCAGEHVAAAAAAAVAVAGAAVVGAAAAAARTSSRHCAAGKAA